VGRKKWHEEVGTTSSFSVGAAEEGESAGQWQMVVLCYGRGGEGWATSLDDKTITPDRLSSTTVNKDLKILFYWMALHAHASFYYR